MGLVGGRSWFCLYFYLENFCGACNRIFDPRLPGCLNIILLKYIYIYIYIYSFGYIGQCNRWESLVKKAKNSP